MIKKFQFHFDELAVLPGEIEELMGFEPGQSPEPFPELIEKGLKEAPPICTIEGGFKKFEKIMVDPTNKIIEIEGQQFSPGAIVIAQLKKAVSGALFACTAGAGITDYAKKITAEGDPFLSYVMDIIGSVTVEKAAEKIQDEIFQSATSNGDGITDPFSPGYCKWSVADQQKLFSLLPPHFAGISLSESSLMSPIKSVSGLTGIGPECQRKGYQCNWCNDRDCIYGKIRRQRNK